MGCDNDLIGRMIDQDTLSAQRDIIKHTQTERVRLEHRVSELNEIISNLEEFRVSTLKILESEREDLSRAQKEIIRIHKLTKECGLRFEEGEV